MKKKQTEKRLETKYKRKEMAKKSLLANAHKTRGNKNEQIDTIHLYIPYRNSLHKSLYKRQIDEKLMAFNTLEIAHEHMIFRRNWYK